MDWKKRFGQAASLLGMAALSYLMAGSAYANWPEDHPITIIVPDAAGGTNDTVARIMAAALSIRLHTGVVIRNQPGASGIIGMEDAAHSRPDGYTLAIASDTAAILSNKPGAAIKLNRDMRAVALIGNQPMGVAVSDTTPYHTLADVIKAAKAKPGTIGFGTSGIGTSQHILGEWISRDSGISLLHVPYKGGGQAIMDLVSGHVPMAVLGLVPLLAQARQHTIRLLAVSTAQRVPSAPDTPTLTELGYKIVRPQWVGIVAPKRTPDAIVQSLSQATLAVLADPQIQQKLNQAGVTPDPLPAEKFSAFVMDDVAQWGELVTSLHIELP